MKLKSKNRTFLRHFPTVILFIIIATILVWSVGDVSRTSLNEGQTITENSIRRAVITCYAYEGSYPESIEYLKEYYGLRVSDDYEVRYNVFAPNIMPDIRVTRKQVVD